MADKLRIGIIGAGRWSKRAHIPGWVRSDLCDLVVICDRDEELAREAAEKFGVPEVMTDAEAMIRRDDLDVIDVCTRDEHGESHEPLTTLAIECGKHVLVEKPVAGDFHRVRELSDLAKSKGLKTKVGLTFRYAPAVQYMFDLVREGKIGTPWLFNGYEQNSQWLNPWYPQDKRLFKEYPTELEKVGTDPDPKKIEMSSLEGYGAPTIDIGLELINDDIEKVVCAMANLVKERRRYNVDDHLERINWDDADMWMGTTKKGYLFSMQTSFVTVGNYPGITAWIYGDKGSLKATLIKDPETHAIQKLEYADGWADPNADANAVKYRELEIPDKYWNPGHQPDDDWDTAFYGCLIQNFLEEIVSGGEKNEGNFEQSARVQELINAADRSHREERWVHLPL
ncbi:Gfo/Idh/MocA family oxidoreductase [uncultured Enorma sp.]|uniref:Gfo/Idh/MocA family protein n=1 Tax=uncultured Enorma sp. TaxID=1714346 RepID=UPI002804DF82|nr:Gfo/Idh/MocA family oxidoreductase [uncultured Enorma sp.]